MKKINYLILALLIFVTLSSCNNPIHTVWEGKQNMIIYRVEKVDGVDANTYKYAISDASGKGWTLYSNTQFNIGDTVKITK